MTVSHRTTHTLIGILKRAPRSTAVQHGGSHQPRRVRHGGRLRCPHSSKCARRVRQVLQLQSQRVLCYCRAAQTPKSDSNLRDCNERRPTRVWRLINTQVVPNIGGGKQTLNLKSERTVNCETHAASDHAKQELSIMDRSPERALQRH